MDDITELIIRRLFKAQDDLHSLKEENRQLRNREASAINNEQIYKSKYEQIEKILEGMIDDNSIN